MHVHVVLQQCRIGLQRSNSTVAYVYTKHVTHSLQIRGIDEVLDLTSDVRSVFFFVCMFLSVFRTALLISGMKYLVRI